MRAAGKKESTDHVLKQHTSQRSELISINVQSHWRPHAATSCTVKAQWGQMHFFPVCSQVETHLMLWTKQDKSISYKWGASLDWRGDIYRCLHPQDCNEIWKTPSSWVIEATSTHRHHSPAQVLFLPDWATTQTGKWDCAGAHPADTSKGKQDTAGQKWPLKPAQPRRTRSYNSKRFQFVKRI